jgi:hypothetical protein
MENVYRNNPTHGALDVLSKRKELYKNGPHYKAATTNPAYFKLTGKGDGGTATIPGYKLDDNFPKSQYNSFKPYPSLEDATITYSPTEYGFKEGLSWSIKCFNRADFEALEKVFCRYGTEISAKFGYPKHWIIDQQSIDIGKFLLVQFEFNTDDSGCWIIKGSAVRASEALKKLELQMGIKAKGLFYLSGGERYEVRGLRDLMTYDAQHNGQKAIDEISFAGNDGITFVPKDKHTYTAPKPFSSSPGAVAIYKASHTTRMSGRISKAIQSISESHFGASATTSSVNIVYYTLEYIVNRLIMGQCHMKYKDDIVLAKEFAPTAIGFDKKLSKTYVGGAAISGLPTHVVFAGNSHGRYSGTFSVGDELGINFEKVAGVGLTPIKAVVGKRPSTEMDIAKILIERSVILDAYEEAAKKEEPNSDKINDKSETEESINVLVFLKKIFKSIKEASGGAISLTLTQHPDYPDLLVIIDQRNGYVDTLDCYVFDGINGDGSSRSINLKSNVGSPEMASSMMAGQTNQGDAVYNLAGKLDAIGEKRKSAFGTAQSEILKLIGSPGDLIKSRFNADVENSLLTNVTTMSTSAPVSHIKKYELPTYPGLELDVTLDGVYGFRIGNAIATEHLSPNYFLNKAYFMVRSVTHTFTADSDWTTQLSGILTFHDSVKYIPKRN